MAQAKVKEDKSNLKDTQYYFNRELSWLEFNNRVLNEALDNRTPLLERLKFSAIFSSNLDEFFMVRVAVLKQQLKAGVTKLTPDGRNPLEQLNAISDRLRPLVKEQDNLFEYKIRNLLINQGIYLINYVDLDQEQRNYLHQYFEENIFPALTPLAVDPSHPFPYISKSSWGITSFCGTSPRIKTSRRRTNSYLDWSTFRTSYCP